MKNIITKIIIGCAVLGAVGMLYWYYDSGGGFGSLGFGGGQGDDGTAIISMSGSGDDSSSAVTADGADAGDAGDSSLENSGNHSTEKAVGIPQKNSNNKAKAIQKSADASGEVADGSSDQDQVNVASDSSTQDVSAQDSSGESATSENVTSENTAATTLAGTSASVQSCSFSPPGVSTASTTASLSRKIILNEIAWMGSVPEAGETSAKASNREWIELKNISATAIDLAGWQIFDSAGNLKIVLGSGGAVGGGAANGVGSSTGNLEITPGGFYLLVRDGQVLAAVGASNIISPDIGYSGGLSNSGDQLELFDPNCDTSDVLDASAGWPGGNNTTKQTMERDADGIGWHTSAAPGGTPRAENSVPVLAAPTSTPPVSAASAQPTIQPTTGASSNTTAVTNTSLPQQYLVSVSTIGGGVGTVSSSPAGILCGFDCEMSYAAGTKLTFTESPAQGSQFEKWSGVCAGAVGGGEAATQCSFTVSSSVAVVADFEPIPPPSTPASQIAPSSTITQDSTSSSSTASSSDSSLGGSGGDGAGTGGNSETNTPPPTSLSHLLIAAVQIAGAASGGESSNDFVKIFNPTGVAVDLSGWKLHKKSSTGTDYSLKSFATGNTIAAGGYFEWANATDGFANSIGADASSTETLSADNSVALFDANGNIVDQVAWGTGTNQYVEGTAFTTDPTAGQVLTRMTAGGAMVDTDNNAVDFAIN